MLGDGVDGERLARAHRAALTSPIAGSRARSALAYSLGLSPRPRSQTVASPLSTTQHRLTPSRPQLIPGHAAACSAGACGRRAAPAGRWPVGRAVPRARSAACGGVVSP